MANTPAGFVPVAQTDTFDPASDINRAELFAEQYISADSPDAAHLPTLFPSPLKGERRWVEAENCGYVWNGSAWTRPVGAVVGRTVWNPAGFEYTMTATDAAVPGASVAVTSPASPLLIRAVAQLANGNSGNSSLTATMQIFEDGTAIGNPRTYFLPQVSGVNPVVTMHLLVQRTPTAGSHTYALHAKASAVSSAVIFDGAISVELN